MQELRALYIHDAKDITVALTLVEVMVIADKSGGAVMFKHVQQGRDGWSICAEDVQARRGRRIEKGWLGKSVMLPPQHSSRPAMHSMEASKLRGLATAVFQADGRRAHVDDRDEGLVDVAQGLAHPVHPFGLLRSEINFLAGRGIPS